MKAFIDTSSLFKKYVDERGSAEFDKLFEIVNDVVVSPVTLVEIESTLAKYTRNRWITVPQADHLRVEIKRDYVYFSTVLWNENLEEKAIQMVHKHALKTLDSIQLASAILSESELFVTSDQKLYQEAKKIVKRAQFI